MLKKISENQITGVKLVKPDVTKKYYHIASDTDIFATIDLIHGQGSLARLETRKVPIRLNVRAFSFLISV